MWIVMAARGGLSGVKGAGLFRMGTDVILGELVVLRIGCFFEAFHFLATDGKARRRGQGEVKKCPFPGRSGCTGKKDVEYAPDL